MSKNFLFTFRKQCCSRFFVSLLHFPEVSSPQTEKALSTYAWEAGVATKSNASGDSNGKHTHTQPFYCWSGICPGPPGSAGTRKVKPRRLKPIWIYWARDSVSGSGICWAICKSAPHADNHANIPPLCFLQAGCPS